MQTETVLPKMKLQAKQPGKTHSGATDPNIQAQNRQTGNARAEQQTHKPTQNSNSSTMAVANATTTPHPLRETNSTASTSLPARKQTCRKHNQQRKTLLAQGKLKRCTQLRLCPWRVCVIYGSNCSQNLSRTDVCSCKLKNLRS